MATETSWGGSTGRARATRCPSCEGLVAPGVDWCTQCFRRLTPPEPPSAAPAPQGAPAESGAASSPVPPPAGLPISPERADDLSETIADLSEAVSTLGRPTTPSHAPEAPQDEFARALADLANAASSVSPDPSRGRPGAPSQGAGPALAPAPPPATLSPAAARTGVRPTAEGFVWTCSKCQRENPVGVRACRVCGSLFEDLFGRADGRPRLAPERVVRLSLLFPGVGHAAAGHMAEGVARAVVFGWTLISALAIVISRGSSGPGPFLPLLVVYLGTAGGLYAVTAIDARRAVEGEKPVLTSRALMYLTGGLILLTVGILFVFGLRVSGR